MKQYYKLFWFLFLVEVGFTPLLLIISYIFKVNFVFLFKVPALLSFVIIVLFNFKKGLRWNFINILFAAFGFFGLLWGLSEHWSTIDAKILPSIYTYLMPVFSISFGIHFAKSYDYILKSYVDKYMMLSFYMLAFVLILYVIFHFIIPLIPYFGFGTKIDFVVAYLLGNNRLGLYGTSLLLVLASGKRATTLNVALISVLYYSRMFLSKKLKDWLIIMGSSIIIIGGMSYAYQNNYLRRFETTFEFDINDKRAAYLATSGRWNEVVGVYEFMEEKPIRWIIGGGLGSKYHYEDNIYGYTRKKDSHYTHISPLGYTFLTGLPFTIILYSYFIYLIIKGRKKNNNFFYLCFVVMIFGGIFGANLFIDHKIWVIVGVSTVLIADTRNKLNISRL